MVSAQPSTDFEALVRADLQDRPSKAMRPHTRDNLTAHRSLLLEPKKWLDTLDVIIYELHRDLDSVHAEIEEIVSSPFYKEEFVEATAKQMSRRSRMSRLALIAEIRRNEVALIVATKDPESEAGILAEAVRQHKAEKNGAGDEADVRLWEILQGEWGFQ